MKMGLCNPGLR